MSIGEDGGFELDWSEFNENFFRVAVEQVPEAAEAGMFDALTALANDADTEQPKTPLLEGNLRGDKTYIIEGIRTSRIVEAKGGRGRDHKTGGASKPAERFGAKDIIAKLVFRMPYAAKWHEAVKKKVNWSESGAGPKYVETKMSRHHNKYFGLVAARIRKALGG